MNARVVLVVWLTVLITIVACEVGLATSITTVRIYPPDTSVSELYRPVFLTAPPGDNDRLFIVQQRLSSASLTQGRIRVLDKQSNSFIGTSFLDTSGQNTGNEEGLLGLAFHPDFYADAPNANRGAFFIYITQGGNNHVVRYTTMDQDPNSNTADPASAQTVIDIAHPTNTNHNGGWISFGPDGYLYIATGDGGSACDPSGNAQNINTLLGKTLRLDVSTDQQPGSSILWGYFNPPDNPFVGIAGLDEIYHYGLRNPWRCSFDRLNGNLYIGDVGQNSREEVSLAPAGVGGLNFGWDVREGFQCSNTISSNCTSTCSSVGRLNPIWDFVWTAGSAVTGGYVYRGDKIPDLKGTYFFANYGNGSIFSFAYSGSCPGPTFQCSAVSVGEVTNRTTELAPTGPVCGLSITSITSFGEDAEGELYILDLTGGEVFKIVPALAISEHPQSQAVTAGEALVLTVSASNLVASPNYVWRHNGDVVGGNSASLLIENMLCNDAGEYTCTVQDLCTSVTSNAATISVTPLPSSPIAGDIDFDHDVDLDDMFVLIDVLLDQDTDAGHVSRADIDGLDCPNALDIQPFIDLLLP